MSQPMVSKAAVRGTASGVLFMAFFGMAWAGIGIGGLRGWGNPWLPILAVVVGIILFTGGIRLMRSSKDLPHHTSDSDSRRGKRMQLGFNITFAAEFVLIAAVGAICGATNHFEYFFPIMALIVGVHFFPLAYLFQVKVHYVAGALLCLLAVATLLFVPVELTVGQHQIIAWFVFTGFGSALILWITGAVLWQMGRHLLNKA